MIDDLRGIRRTPARTAASNALGLLAALALTPVLYLSEFGPELRAAWRMGPSFALCQAHRYALGSVVDAWGGY